MSASEELHDFLETDAPGLQSQYSRDTVLRAAEKMFTAVGKPCPVNIIKMRGKTYIIRREAMPK